ncbi:MAG: translation initiation factor IF-2 [Planctomycetota bacterium]
MGLRVYELAKEIGKDSKYLLLICHDLNMTDVENHMNVLTDEQEDRIREYMGAPPAVRTGEAEPPKKKRTRPAATGEKPKRRPRKKAPKKAEVPPEGEGETVVAAEVAPAPDMVQPAVAEAATVEMGEIAQAGAESMAAQQGPAAEAPPGATEEAVGVTEAPVKSAKPKRGKDLLEWTPRVRITGSAAVGRIKLPTAPSAEPEPVSEIPIETRSPALRKGVPVVAEEEGEKRPRGGKKVFVPPKDDSYRLRHHRRRSDHRTAREQVQRPAVVVERPSAVEIAFPVTVKSLSEAMGIKANELLRKLMETGVFATINDILDKDVVEMLGTEFQVAVTIRKPRNLEAELLGPRVEDRPEDLHTRAPVVVFLGHVDHGKTSLLDAIRKTRVTESEAGGITQHFSAYKVGNVVFLDTPGHEAFTEMRARGANVTDVAVLVVAADDGVMPQTEEAINHARAAEVPIVVALNKIDKPEADPMRVKGQLASVGLAPEEWGGKTIVVEVSALTGEGLPKLLEMLALEAELLELKANPNKAASGTVLEAQVSEGRGNLATILVQEGTLRRGEVILCGAGYGRVREIHDDQGNVIEEAPPSTPVEIWGLSEVPEAGDKFFAVEGLSRARGVAAEKQRLMRQQRLAERHHVTLENLFSRIEAGKVKDLRIVLKADVKGSVEALTSSLKELSTDEVKVRILHAAVGGIMESDVLLADASDAIIVGFHVTAEEQARVLAEDRRVEIRLYDVIYQAISDVQKAMEGLLEPEEREIVTGHAAVRQLFRISRVGVVAGCQVTDGVVERSNSTRLVREGKVVHVGSIQGLRREKNDAREVREGFECGIKILDYDDVKPGDVIECFRVEKVARKLE